MAFDQKFNSLYQAYNSARNQALSADDFLQVLITLPALLVAKADGKVDEKEKMFLSEIAKGLATQSIHITNAINHNPDDLAKLLIGEYEYLLDHLNKWQVQFIDTLAVYLQEENDIKPMIEHMMTDIAEISQGICDDERVYIQQLVKTLKLK